MRNKMTITEAILISTSELAHGDLFRVLDRGGDYVLFGTLADLLADKTEDAQRAVYRQIGEGEDAYSETVAYA